MEASVCLRCKARERVLERAAGDRRSIDPDLWGVLYGQTEKLQWLRDAREGYLPPAHAPKGQAQA